MKIFVIRHGLTKSNILGILNGQSIDEPLEEEGMQQVREIISTIPTNISKIYSSNMLRTIQTAEILNEYLNLDLSFHPELREISFGNLEGKTWIEIKKEYGENVWDSYVNQVYDFTPYHGESFSLAKTRIENFLNKIKSNHKDDENVLLVSHGGIVRLLSHLYKNEHYESLGNAAIREFDI